MKLKKICSVAIASSFICLLSNCGKTEIIASSTTTTLVVVPVTLATTTTTTTTTTLAPYTDSEYETAKKRMRTEVDKVQNITWISDKTAPTSWANSFDLYIGSKPGMDPWFRFKVSYYGSDWIFFTKEIINVDGILFNIEHEYFDMKHDNSGGGVFEWIDVKPSDADISMLRSIAKSESTIVRLQGDTYKKDLEITAKQKQAIQNVFTVYEGLKRGKIDF